MKTSARLLLIGMFLFSFSAIAQTQEKKNEFTLTVGFVNRIAIEQFGNTGKGLYLGVNMYKRNAEGFTTDAQLSLNFVNLDNSSTNVLQINALYGVRFYFSKRESSSRIFANVLLGPAFKNESGDDFTESLIDVGYSGGMFLESKRMVFGVSLDAPQNLALKVGYTF